MPTTVLGKVYSPDPDDWDNKTYVFEGHLPSYFILNTRTGFLIIKENAPTGAYEFQVRVSDGVWPDAVSTITVHVRELRDEAIYNSASLRLAELPHSPLKSVPLQKITPIINPRLLGSQLP
ncbi:hypothetical protein JOQ06_009675 [Pogonophryne albipinna]|uniref:Cadherin domain-containing protein n=1 Tax=Pogonophryne albipinna TaxID=1090488 RepID=A0AAD6FTG2_9TELE|nr:hypothetical protein JOQ06_009675 [Pogonophryne albipinna]